MNNNLKPIQSGLYNISKNRSVIVKLKDAIEGDIELEVKILEKKEDKNSYTIIEPINLSYAVMTIVNPSALEITTLSTPIHVGTYNANYELYLNFILSAPSKSDGNRQLTIVFYKKEKKL